MNDALLPRIDTAVCLLFGAALLLLLKLHLLPALLAGLLVYALVHALAQAMLPLLRTRLLDHQGLRLVAVTLIATVVIALIAFGGMALSSFLRGSAESLPQLLSRMAEIVENSRERLPGWLMQFVPGDADELRRAMVAWLTDHAQAFQVAGTGLGRAFAHILIGMVIGALLSLDAARAPHESPPLTAALAERGRRLAEAFRRVVFAQFWISAINTLFTGIFLAGVLPALGVHLPFTKTLILVTFVAGLIPILGNLISNTAIFIVGLSQSIYVALGALLYLVVIHKLEYFLNARIASSSSAASTFSSTMSAVRSACGLLPSSNRRRSMRKSAAP